MSDDYEVTINGVPARFIKAISFPGSVPTVTSVWNIPAIASFHISVTKEDDCYMARLTHQSLALALTDGMFGTGDTPLEAFYDFCEVVAEWGLDGERRDYPPTLWMRFKRWLGGLR